MFKSEYGLIINTFKPHYASNCLIVTGAIVCCVCYLGILGALRENRCMLISVSLARRAPMGRTITAGSQCLPCLARGLVTECCCYFCDKMLQVVKGESGHLYSK